MEKKVTVAELNKRIKSLLVKRNNLLDKEDRSKTFLCSSTEDPELLRPEYDFVETQNELHEIEDKIRKYKHAINVFNSTTTVGDTGLTIDQMLIRIPQLSYEVDKLEKMSDRMKRERVDRFRDSSNVIDYILVNYDIDLVTKEFEEKEALLAKYQIALDKTNISSEITIEE